MNNLKPQKVITIALHSLFWLAISFFYFSISNSRVTYEDKGVFYDKQYYDLQYLIPLLVGNIFKAILFYGNANFLIVSFLKEKRYLTYLANFLGLLVICYGLEIGVDYTLVEMVPPTAPFDKNPPNQFKGLIAIQPAFYLLFIAISFGARFTQDWVEHENEKRDLQEAQLQTELKFLRSQINPHFLFNTLNNLYASALNDGSERTAQGIAKLSGLIRYMLHESNVKEIALSKEITYIQNYIELQKSRFTGKQYPVIVNFDIDIDRDDYQLAPMLLITFVENAFKHGLSKQQSSRIDIRLKIVSDYLTFEVENTINPMAKNNLEEKSGLGLKNTQRRLELMYPAQHTLEIEATTTLFRSILSIQLPSNT